MTIYFSDAERAAALLAEMERWVGTPFFPDSCAAGPGGGVDCLRLAEELMVATGAVPTRGCFPATPMDWSLHSREDKITPWLDGTAEDPHSAVLAGIFRRVYERPPEADEHECLPVEMMLGDLLLYRVGHCINHLGVAAGKLSMLHVMRPLGCDLVRCDVEPFSPRLMRVYRAFTP